MYTSVQIGEVRRLYAKGLNDYEIANYSGIPRHTVRRIRIREALPPVKRNKSNHIGIYRISDPFTGEVLFTGSASDAAVFLGLNLGSFFTTVNRSRKGEYKRFVIRNIKRKEFFEQ